MAIASVRKSGLPETNYYAPNFKVEVEGQELDPESHGDILDLKVTMDIKNITNFNLTVNNWNAKDFEFKYSDTTTFDLGNRVHIEMGYADQMLFMVYGIITKLTPKFPESGSSTLIVEGLDSMFKLRDSKPKEGEITNYINKADWEIAQIIAERNGLKPVVTQEGEMRSEVIQKNKQDDAQFLIELANRNDFDCFVLTDPQSGEDALHFIKPSDGRDSKPIKTYVLEWGKTLKSFSPRLNANGQVSEITVRSWDSETKSSIAYTANDNDLPQSDNKGTSGPEIAKKLFPRKRDKVVDASVTSEQEAKDLAKSLLRERAYKFLNGTGQIIGLPDLRPGDNLELKGLGQRFSGNYYVEKVTHTIGNSGYHTEFEVRSPFDGGIKK